MNRKLFWLACALVGLIVGPCSATRAATLYAIDGKGVLGATSSLYTVDTTTGLATLIGPTGFTEVSGIDFDPVTGTLYGVANNQVGNTGTGVQELITINTLTGVGTAVAPLSPGFQAPDLAFRSDGTLYSWNGRKTSPSDLHTINLTTGATTDIGPSGFDDIGRIGLAFSPDGTLYWKAQNELYTIDPSTGLPTLVASIGQFVTLTFDTSGRAFTLDGMGQLWTLDVSTGVGTLVAATGVDTMSGLAFSPTAVPLPAALPLFAGGLGVMGWFARRRWQRNHIT